MEYSDIETLILKQADSKKDMTANETFKLDQEATLYILMNTL